MVERPSPLSISSTIRTPDQRLRVFVSSTLEELADERAAVRDSIERLRLTPVMFELGARPYPPRDLYRSYLDQSQVFVGIYWQRYGWIAPGEDISGLEDEYRLSGTRPKLIYVKRPATDREPRLATLLGRIEADATASYRLFTDPSELADLVQNDLAVLLSERFEVAGSSTGRVPHRSNLPTPRNQLIGREKELAVACAMLRQADVSLLTLVGPGGSGKSRLGLQIALEVIDHFEDGVYLVMLEAIRDPGLVLPAIATTVGVREVPGRSTADVLAERLRDAHMLLLLDNFEQVATAADAVGALLEGCPRLAVLATSRTPLRVRAERLLTVPPLQLPVGSPSDLERLSQFAAVTLFIHRARAVSPGFRVTDDNAAMVAEICHRLDGLPLAIELAAARLRVLSPADLLSRLDRRFELLRGGTRDLPERQQTLRRTIEWSHDLLDESAARMFRRLAVFSGGSTLEAAETVCTLEGEPVERSLDLVADLIDSSMVTGSVSEQGAMRLGMLDSTRAFAFERLVESGELEEIRYRHVAFFLELAEQAQPHLVGPEEPGWARRLEAERDNFRAVLEWSLGHDSEIGLRTGAALFRFWETHNLITEGHDWLERLLERPGQADLTRARGLQAAAALACYLGRPQVAMARMTEALPIFEVSGDPSRIANALNEAGLVASYAGDYPTSRRLLERSLVMKRTIGDEWAMANGLLNLGLVAGYLGDNAAARSYLEESLDAYRSVGDREGVAIATSNIAHAHFRGGRFDDARSGQLEALRLFHQIGDLDGAAECVERLALLAGASGDSSGAVRLFGLAEALRVETGTLLPPYEQAEVDSGIEALRSHLDETIFNREWESGGRMTLDEGLALATPRPVGAARR